MTPYYSKPQNFSFCSPLQERRRENYAVTNERIDYKILFEKERSEREKYERKIKDMEKQQKILEDNLRKFLDLKNEFSFLQNEAEESDKIVNNFILVKQC